MAEEALAFGSIALGGRGPLDQGALKLNADGIMWGSKATSKTVQISKADIHALECVPIPHSNQLRVRLSNGKYEKFNGLKDKDVASISEFGKKNYGVGVKKKVEVSTKGLNWGDVSFSGDMMSFSVDKAQSFEINLADVSQSVLGKNEVALEFHQDDSAAKDDETLVEMRFYVPTKDATDGDEMSPEFFHSKVVERADIQSAGECIVSFSELWFLTPRGHYGIEMFDKFMKLRGKTHNLKVLYSSITQMFLLPNPDRKNMFFVISLDKPIRQGQTTYSHLVMQFDKDDTLPEFAVQLPAEVIETKYKDKLEPRMGGPTFEVVARIARALSEKKIIGQGKFRTAENPEVGGISCSHKANEGVLFPLEKSFFFLHKPPLYIKHDDIRQVKFERGGGGSAATKTFELSIVLKNSTVLGFSNIKRSEHDKLFSFLETKSLKLENAEKKADEKKKQVLEQVLREEGAEDSEEEDSDFDGKSSESESGGSEVEEDNPTLDTDLVDKPDDAAKRKRRETAAASSDEPKEKKKKA